VKIGTGGLPSLYSYWSLCPKTVGEEQEVPVAVGQKTMFRIGFVLSVANVAR
jgi:hypothetical protein